MHIVTYLGLSEVTIDITNLGTHVYCLAEMGILASKFSFRNFSLVTMEALQLRTFPELLLLQMLPCVVGEEKKVFFVFYFAGLR